MVVKHLLLTKVGLSGLLKLFSGSFIDIKLYASLVVISIRMGCFVHREQRIYKVKLAM